MSKRIYYYSYVDGVLQKVRRTSRPEGSWITYEELKNAQNPDSKTPSIESTVALEPKFVPIQAENKPELIKVEPKTDRIQKPEGCIDDTQILRDTIKKLVKAEVKIKELEAENATLKKRMEHDPVAVRKISEERVNKELDELDNMCVRIKESAVKDDQFFEMKRQNTGHLQRIQLLEARIKQLEGYLSAKSVAF